MNKPVSTLEVNPKAVKGKGPKGRDWAGMYPAACVVWTDKTCKELDEEAYRELLRDMLVPEIAGLFVSSAHEGLSLPERLRVLRIAKEEAKGRVPVTGGVMGDWTWQAVEQGKANVDAGADIIYFVPPTIPGTDYDRDDKIILNHFRMFAKAVKAPFIVPAWVQGPAAHYIPAKTLKKIALECENLVGYKLEVMTSIRGMKAAVAAMQEVEEESGRHVCPFLAGDHGLAEMLANGAEGNVNGGGVWRGREDVAIYQAVKKGDLTSALEIQERLAPTCDAIRGMFGTTIRPYGDFPYRYKIVAWLMGKIPRPYARAPFMPVSKEEVLWLREAVIKSGLKAVRKASECREFEASEY
ncbi:MAG: dihydrodipicolinate synthase family protein [Pseudomonadota bacterium]